MRRRLFNLAAVLSLLLCVVTAGLWLLSYRRELQLIETQHEDLSVRDGRFLYQHDSATRDDPVEQKWEMGGSLLQLVYYDSGGDDRWAMLIITAGWLPALLMSALALPAVVLAMRRRRREQARRLHLCPACGYDLRATPERCPECGAVQPKPRASRHAALR